MKRIFSVGLLLAALALSTFSVNGCGAATDGNDQASPNAQVTATESALAWVGTATFTGGVVSCGGASWYPSQQITQSYTRPIAGSPYYTTQFGAVGSWGPPSTAPNGANQVAVICAPNSTMTNVSGYYYNNAARTCAVWTRLGLPGSPWFQEGWASIGYQSALYDPNGIGPNGAWGMNLYVPATATPGPLFTACGLAANGGYLWYMFY